MKKILAGILVILFGFIVFQFFATEDSKNEEPYLTGQIHSIENSRILVAEGIEEETFTGDIDELIGKAGWFTAEEETRIEGIEGEFLSFEDLKERDKVKVWVTGPVMESYPVQATASKIVLIERTKEDPGEETVSIYYQTDFTHEEEEFEAIERAVKKGEKEEMIKRALELWLDPEITEEEMNAGFPSDFPRGGLEHVEGIEEVRIEEDNVVVHFATDPEKEGIPIAGSARVMGYSEEISRTVRAIMPEKEVRLEPYWLFQP